MKLTCHDPQRIILLLKKIITRSCRCREFNCSGMNQKVHEQMCQINLKPKFYRQKIFNQDQEYRLAKNLSIDHC